MEETRRLYLSEREAASLLNVSVATLARWRRAKTGPLPYRLGGRHKYTEHDLRAWAEKRRVGGETR